MEILQQIWFDIFAWKVPPADKCFIDCLALRWFVLQSRRVVGCIRFYTNMGQYFYKICIVRICDIFAALKKKATGDLKKLKTWNQSQLASNQTLFNTFCFLFFCNFEGHFNGMIQIGLKTSFNNL